MTTVEGLPQVHFAHRFLSADPVPFHEHHCPELVLVTRGKCVIQVGNIALTGRRGDVFLLPARILHNQVGTGMVGTLYIGFLPGSDGMDNTARVVCAADDVHTRDWITSIVEFHRDSELSPVVMNGLLMALLARLKHLEGRADPSMSHPKVQAALDYVRQRVNQSMNIASISRAVGVSPSHMRTLFRQHVGISPREFLMSLRMSLARQRLLDPYPSIKEVAVECGYRDVNLFIRLFRKQHGRSPGRWRADVSNHKQ